MAFLPCVSSGDVSSGRLAQKPCCKTDTCTACLQDAFAHGSLDDRSVRTLCDITDTRMASLRCEFSCVSADGRSVQMTCDTTGIDDAFLSDPSNWHCEHGANLTPREQGVHSVSDCCTNRVYLLDSSFKVTISMLNHIHYIG